MGKETDVHSNSIEQIWGQNRGIDERVIKCLAYIQGMVKTAGMPDETIRIAFLTLIKQFESDIQTSRISDSEKERKFMAFIGKIFPQEFSMINAIWEKEGSSEARKIIRSMDVIRDYKMPQNIRQTARNNEQSICSLFMLVYLYARKGGTSPNKMVPYGHRPSEENEVREFGAKILKLRNISADVEIMPYEGSTIRLQIKPDFNKTELEFNYADGMLRVEEKDHIPRNDGISIKGLGCSIDIKDGSLAINGRRIFGGRPSSKPFRNSKLVIQVPVGTSVDVQEIYGEVNIGDIFGILQVCTCGHNKIRAGRVKSAYLVVGAEDISVKEAFGDLNIEIAGSGSATVERGNISMMYASVRGTGNVRFGGAADVARMLEVVGGGTIEVEHVNQYPIRHITGKGTIKVKNWP